MKQKFRTHLSRGLNLLLLLCSSFILGTAWLMDQRLPRGRGGHGLTFLGLDRHDWGDWHTWVGYGVGVLIVAHLALHRAWLQKVAAQQHPWRLVAGLGVAAAVVAFFALVPVSQ